MLKKEYFDHKNNDLILDEILKNIPFQQHQLVVNGISSYNSFVDYGNFKGLFMPYLKKFCKMAGKGFNVLDFWINIVKPGGFTKTHNHITSIKELKNIPMKTGVFYLKKPKNSGNIIIENKLIKIKQNDIIVFENWMNHKTEINKSKENRIIFSINLAKGIEKKNLNNKYIFIKQ